MRVGALVLALGALGSCAATPRPAQVGWNGPPEVYQSEHVSLTVGQRSFEDERAEPVDDQLFLALNIEVEPVNSWLALDLGLNYSVDKATQTTGGLGTQDLEVNVWELSAGLYKELRLGRSPLRPYLGIGASLLLVDATLTDSAGANLFEDRDTGFGTYARAGLLYELSRGNQIGVDVRYLTGDAADIGGLVVDSDYTSIGLIFRGSF